MLSLLVTGGCTDDDSISNAAGEFEIIGAQPSTADTVQPSSVASFRSKQERLRGYTELKSRSKSAAGLVEQSTLLDWPAIFGPNHNSTYEHPNLDLAWPDSGPRQLWRMEIGSGYGSPVVVGDHLVFNHRIGDEEIVQCVNARDGSERWDYRFPTSYECQFEYSSGPYSSPTIDDGCVFGAGGQGQFYCLNLDDGQEIWRRDLHNEYEMEDGLFPVAASPLVFRDSVVFNLGAEDKNAGIISMNRDDGTILWQTNDDPPGNCLPVLARIGDQEHLFVMTHFGLVSLDPSSGAIDWRYVHFCRASMSFNSVTPIVVGNRVLIVTGPGPGAVCLEVLPDRSHKVLWRNRRVIDCQYNTLMPHDGSAIGFTSARQGGAELRCVSLSDGSLQWKYHSVLKRGQAILMNQTVVVLGEQGHLASLMVTGEGVEPIGFTFEPIMQAPCYSPPAINRNRLFLRDDTQIACFDLGYSNSKASTASTSGTKLSPES